RPLRRFAATRSIRHRTNNEILLRMSFCIPAGRRQYAVLLRSSLQELQFRKEPHLAPAAIPTHAEYPAKHYRAMTKPYRYRHVADHRETGRSHSLPAPVLSFA